MENKDCIFCKIAAGEIPAARIYEDETVVAFLDIGPLSEGHTLVIPREHIACLDECPADVLGAVMAVVKKVAPAVQTATQAEGYNVLCNKGRSAGQLVEHLHFHIIPRRSGDGLFARWPAGKYEGERMQTVAEEIRKRL